MNSREKKELYKICISFALFLGGFFTDIEWCRIGIYVLSFLIVGAEPLKKAFMHAMKGKFFDENFLMTIAGLGAFAVGEYSEAAAVMIFYQIGELFQSYSVGKSRESIAELMNICPNIAVVEKDGVQSEVSPEAVNIGDIVVIKSGEKVPVDGVVISGKTFFDTSPITGENVPRTATCGDYVVSGIINRESMVKIRAEKKFEDSTVSKILELVENSSMAKAKTEKFITKFSRYYTPTVVLMAACLAFIPPIFGGTLSDWGYRALSFLVVSCPCALVISVPLSFFGGIGAASKHGILIKGANCLETLSKCKTFAFDKTGTLTKGVFEVTAVNAFGISNEEFIKYLAIAESGSTHPIAKAVLKKYTPTDCKVDVSEIPGMGIKALYDGKEILAGNRILMEKNGILGEKCNTCGTVIYMAINGGYVGYAVVSDTIKRECCEGLAGLYRLGIEKTVMLTGDTYKNAQFIKDQLPMDDFVAELLPEDKVYEFKRLLKDGKFAAYVGDGLNDAPVLAMASCGIAMGGIGSDASVEAADIVVVDDDMEKLPLAVKISLETMKIVKQNIVFAIGVKLIILILSAIGITNMWLAVFADVGVAFIAILNAMRTLRIK